MIECNALNCTGTDADFAKDLVANHNVGPNDSGKKRKRVRKRIAANSLNHNLFSVSLLDQKTQRFEDRRATACAHPYLVSV